MTRDEVPNTRRPTPTTENTPQSLRRRMSEWDEATGESCAQDVDGGCEDTF